ncbi:hypothetical protein GQ53DRAFT_668213 [Thozetella sp. PMI_491]|nr:hypothetical protein GQ53DRAFT_668213 [Thozetella sp. PMI_491]
MGVSMSTLGGWALIFSLAGYYVYRYANDGRARELGKAASQRQRLEDRNNVQQKKDSKEKAKRVRGDAYGKEVEDSDKSVKSKARAAKPAPAPVHNVVYSSDDGVDNREFARQLASVKAGTNFDGPKKNEQKKAKSVKQSRAREIDTPADTRVVSAPSSTAGVDADDDESSIPSPEVRAADHGDVSDMLEPKAAGPSVLRLTDTDKVKQKEKMAKAPEKVETKKQRQNRQKAEAAKALREETEKERKVAMEAQRRLARISEGRAAQDGSAFMAAQKQNAWKGNTNAAQANDPAAAVQLLDTLSTTPVPKPSVAPAAKTSSSEDWMSSLPSEEEQLEQLLADEEWSTVTTKKSSKGKKKEEPASEEQNGAKAVAAPQNVAPVAAIPAATKTPKPNGTKPALGQQSSFAALTAEEPEEVEEEWDV